MGQQVDVGMAEVIPLRRPTDAGRQRIEADFAGLAHLLRQAYSTAGEAHLIALRRRGAHPILGGRVNTLHVEALDEIVKSTEEATAVTKRALESVGTIPPRTWGVSTWP